MRKHYDTFFNKDKENIKKIFDLFLNKLFDKDKSKIFYNNYKEFNYYEELKNKKIFDGSNFKDEEFANEMVSYFDNTIKWDNPNVMYNIHPNVNLYSQVVSFFVSLFNPNFAQDLSSGKTMLAEKEVIKYLLTLVGWDTNKGSGIFTFGGKATNLYALKIALDKSFPNLRNEGIYNQKIKIFSTDKGHPAHQEICNWLGIGIKNLIRVKTKKSIIIESEFERLLEICFIENTTVPLIILNGVTTLEHAVDNIKNIVLIRDKLCLKYNITYIPHIHVDSVIGWVYLFYKEYDFKSNPLNINKNILLKIQEKYNLIKNINYADSFGVDFHKTGFTSYVSSIFIIKDSSALYNIEQVRKKDDRNISYSEYSPFTYTLELSRSSHGPISALASLKTMGVKGFQEVISNITESAFYIKKELNKYNFIQVCNEYENSLPIFFILKPCHNIEITDNMDIELVNNIKEYNMDFYRFLIEKLKNNNANIFFSNSKSYKYLGYSFGTIKLYQFNSNSNIENAKIFINELIILIDEYKKLDTMPKSNFNSFFEFLDIKG